MVNLLFCRPGRCTALARCPNLPGSTAMPSPSLAVLVAFIAWALLLLALMEILRTRLVLAGTVAANRFAPDNAGLSPFMQCLARARQLHRGPAAFRRAAAGGRRVRTRGGHRPAGLAVP